MNYVAHILLTFPNELVSLGNMAGDMLRNKEVGVLQRDVAKGVTVHRIIDSTTDNHDAMRTVVKLLRPNHSKYAPVVLDILLDYVLVERWEEFSTTSFDEAEEWTYQLIQQQTALLPDRVATNLLSMARGRWLSDYRSEEGLIRVMSRMDRRARFPSNFGIAGEDLARNYQELSNALDEVWPDLTQAIAKSLIPRNAVKS